jgi:hypothetical protein
MALIWSAVACVSTPTATPIPSTVTSIPRTAIPVPPTAAPAPSVPSATATTPSNLRQDTLELAAPITEDDAGTILSDLQNLAGVTDAQTNELVIQITYDPNKITLQQIITVIESFGIHIKK